MEKLCKVLEMELKTYTSVGLKSVFEKIKFEVSHYIQHAFIHQRPGLSKVQISMFKSLLLTISSSNIVTHSNGYIKGDKYFCFYKSRCGKCSPETKLFPKESRDTLQKDHIYHTKQYQTFYRKIKCDLLNFLGVKNWYYQDFQYLMVSFFIN